MENAALLQNTKTNVSKEERHNRNTMCMAAFAKTSGWISGVGSHESSNLWVVEGVGTGHRTGFYSANHVLSFDLDD